MSDTLNVNLRHVIISLSGGIPTFVRADGGRYTPTSVRRSSGRPTGTVKFDFPTHPKGVGYIVSSCGHGNNVIYTRTSTTVAISIRNGTTLALQDYEVHVSISAY